MGHALAFASALFAADGQGGKSMNVVHITHAQSPYAAAANQTVVVDVSGGARKGETRVCTAKFSGEATYL